LFIPRLLPSLLEGTGPKVIMMDNAFFRFKHHSDRQILTASLIGVVGFCF